MLDDRGHPAVDGLDLRGAGGRDPRHRRRRRQRPARAGRGARAGCAGPAPATSSSTARTSRTASTADASTVSACRTSPRTARSTASSPTTRSPPTSCSSASTSRRSPSGILRDFGAVEAHATEQVERFDVRPRGIHNRMGSLSGGNKQKVIVARELTQGANLVIAAQPTRGVDVGSIEFIHRQLVDQRDARRGRAAGVGRARRGARPGRPGGGDLRGPDPGRAARSPTRPGRRSAC